MRNRRCPINSKKAKSILPSFSWMSRAWRQTWNLAGSSAPCPNSKARSSIVQDFASYQRGIHFESPNADEEATFITGAARHIFEYERALDAIMACALGGEKGRTTKRAASATPAVGDTSRTLDV